MNNLQQSQLKKPAIIQIISAVFVTILSRKIHTEQIKLPQQIRDYLLDSEIKKEDSIHNMAIGIYTSHDNKFLVKRWEGGMKDLEYYALVNEYVVSSLFSKKVLEANLSVKFPLAIEYIKDDQSLTVVFEYVDGTLLSRRYRYTGTYCCDGFRLF